MPTYAGIGSRQTPESVLALMRELASALAGRGYTLRSGGAEGADSAFEAGCDAASGKKEIFLPWDGFAGRHAAPGVFVGVGVNAMALAAKYHPAWDRLRGPARMLHARNGYQVLGRKLDDPVDFVACWTPEGKGAGGTGQAIRIARASGIRVFDLGWPGLPSIDCHAFMEMMP